MAAFSFDPNEVKIESQFSAMPAGEYLAQIVDSEVKPTKSGSGMVLKLTWKVVDGQFANRNVFEYVNMQNQNPTAEKIGKETLTKICSAIGVTARVTDSTQLHGKPAKIVLAVKQDPQFGESNEIKAYKKASSVAQPFAAPAPAAQASAAPPWQRNAA